MQPASPGRGPQSRTRSASGRASPAFVEIEEDQPSPGKRQKVGHDNPGPSKLQTGSPKPKTMYSFGAPVIDLTSSPPKAGTSPQQRRVSGAIRPTNLNAGSGAKNLSVKNLKSSTKSNSAQYCEKIWEQVSEGLDILFQQDTKPFSLEELYRGVENVCRQGQAQMLFEKLQTRCTDEIRGTASTALSEKAKTSSNQDLVRAVTESWVMWRRQMNSVRSIFYYMDRSYLLRSPGKPSIDELGIDLFRKYIFENPELKLKIIYGICDLLAKDRTQDTMQTPDSALFKESIAMSQTLIVYSQVVKVYLLTASQSYFTRWQEEQAAALNLPQYVSAVRSLMAREIQRCKDYGLEEATQRDLERQMETWLISKQEKKLTSEAEFAELMEGNQFENLHRLYELLSLVQKNLGLQDPFEKYIGATGSSIIFDEEREAEMIPRLLQFKKKLDLIWEKCFSKNPDLGHTLRQSFEAFMNKTQKSNMTWGTDNEKPGEMIAKYVDMILRGGSKAIPQIAVDDSLKASTTDEQEADNEDMDEDEQINKQLDQVLELFRFVHGKAVFEAFYKTALAKRLLMNRSASADAEKNMLSRLKNECGPNFTHNLEQMFKDIEMAREENLGFKNVVEARHGKAEVDLTVNVCSSAAWPTYGDVEIEIPISIQKATAEYEAYYKSKYAGRMLKWKHAQSHCQMTANFPKGRKEIIVSGFQAIVMLYFNGQPADEPARYDELQAATKLDDTELKRTLQSLACARYRVLTKSPKGKDVNFTDKFVVNMSFSDPKYRIKINQIQLKETKEENKQTHERVAADRQYETQAAIVRIMKSKKTINHPLLVAEVINATKSRGAINAEDIKKQIDKLIDKDYMERNDNGSYDYIA